MAVNRDLLAKAIVDAKLMSEKNMAAFVKQSEKQGVALEDILFEREAVLPSKLTALVAGLYGVPMVNLAEKSIADSLLRVVPYKLAAHQFIIPFDLEGNKLKVATYRPDNEETLSFIETKTGKEVAIYYASKKDIQIALKAYNKNVNEKFNKLLEGVMSDPKKIESLNDAAKILDTIILFGFQNNASDIHIEPHKNILLVRYRIDGILQTIAELPPEVMELLTTRIKVLANMRTDEHRAAQDGRFKIDLEGNEITMRVSIVPTYDGEKTVLRLLTSTNQGLSLESMGYSEKNLEVIRRNILKTNGILLVTGPTGSGKTTTLYSILRIVSSPEVNVATVEDPIEYRLEGVNQIQVNPKTNLTFAAGLRALLRQDPDVIMVGEIRDEETANIAINAALTGHLVLATLHTNNAAATLPRLAEMGVEPFLLGATAKMVVAQRLVRTICEHCKEEYVIAFSDLKGLQEKFSLNKDLEAIFVGLGLDATKGIRLFKGKGCAHCDESGYKGRSSIAEVIEVSDKIKQMIIDEKQPDDIAGASKEAGARTIFEDGLIKVLQGKTTLEEVLRVMRD